MPRDRRPKILVVAWREFKYTALTKAFFIGAILAPMLMLALITIMPALLNTELKPLSGAIGVIDPSGKIVPELRQELDSEQKQKTESALPDLSTFDPVARGMTGAGDQAQTIDLEIRSSRDADQLQLFKGEVRDGTLVAAVLVDPGALAESSNDDDGFKLFIPGDSAPRHTLFIEQAVKQAIIRARVSSSGDDYKAMKQLLRSPDSSVLRLSDAGGQSTESIAARMFIPLGFMMLLWISTFTSGNYLLTSTIEEKSNRVMEVLLSAVSPMQLMTGKILGQGLVCLIMTLMYGGMGLAGLLALAMFDLVPVLHLVYMAIYLVMAYFMIGTIMAAVGSAVSDLRDAQSLITPAMILLMIPLFLWFPISENPNGILATTTSYIPPLIPFVMILRVTASAEPVATWQVISSMIAGGFWVLVMLWMCGRIFRVGVLMQGKPPSPLELLKWIRYS